MRTQTMAICRPAARVRAAALLPLLGCLALAAPAHADGAAQSSAAAPSAFELERFYGLGITEQRLDGATAVVGWRISEAWDVGQRDQKNAEDGLSLVWQGERKQVSVSFDEIRFVRRF